MVHWQEGLRQKFTNRLALYRRRLADLCGHCPAKKKKKKLPCLQTHLMNLVGNKAMTSLTVTACLFSLIAVFTVDSTQSAVRDPCRGNVERLK